MAIITVSRGAHSKGKEIAEEVAHRLGYKCVCREVLLRASAKFDIPEVKLAGALRDAPSVLQRFTYGKEEYVAHIQEAFLKEVQEDNVVYHGLAGHFFLKGVAHTLKVRIIADLDDRVRLVMKQEKLSKQEARRFLEEVDAERRKWALSLYGIDTTDPSLYDLVIHVQILQADDAVRLICEATELPQFQTTPESQRALDGLVLAAQVRSAILHEWPEAKVSADNGKVVVHVDAPVVREAAIRKQIVLAVEQVPGVTQAQASVHPGMYLDS